MEHYYAQLGVSKNTSPAEIKKKFRQFQLEFDNKTNNTPEMQETYKKMCDAYTILSNSKLREEYDKSIERDVVLSESVYETPINSKAVDMFTVIGEQLLTNVMKNMTNLDSIPPVHNTMPYNFSNIPNVPHVPQVQTMKEISSSEQIIVPPLVQTLPVTYMQAYKGCVLPIEIERKLYNNETSTSFTTESETVYINIPQGIDNNEILFFSNKGDAIGNHYGELKVSVQLVDNEIYKRDGLDLIYTKKITLKESLCGCTFFLEHLNKKSFKISTHGNVVNPNHKQRIPLLGFQRLDSTTIGDLVINFEIVFPETLSNEDMETLKGVLP